MFEAVRGGFPEEEVLELGHEGWVGVHQDSTFIPSFNKPHWFPNNQRL